MTSHNPTIEVLSGPERRRRWSTAEKLAIVQETYEPDATVSIVARHYGIQPNQLFTWRKLAAQGALTARASQEEVVPATEYRALQNQVKDCSACSARRLWKGKSSKRRLRSPPAQKNICCARCRCRREVPDDGSIRPNARPIAPYLARACRAHSIRMPYVRFTLVPAAAAASAATFPRA